MQGKGAREVWEKAVIQIHGLGPWGITYFNPADDPRTAATPATATL